MKKEKSFKNLDFSKKSKIYDVYSFQDKEWNAFA
jgi:hypothetical protein